MGKTKKRAKKKTVLNDLGNPVIPLDHTTALNYLKTTAMPLKEELAFILDVDEDTITNRAKNDAVFGAIVKKIELKQKIYLSRIAPDKNFATRGVLFLLNVNHGKVETQRSEIANPDGKTFSVTSDNFNKLNDQDLTDLLRRTSQESNQG